MAWYVDASDLTSVKKTKIWWTTVYSPGEDVPVSGIYQCLGCKKEVTSNQGEPFPPQSHHQHSQAQGLIRWKLIVRTNTNGD